MLHCVEVYSVCTQGGLQHTATHCNTLQHQIQGRLQQTATLQTPCKQHRCSYPCIPMAAHAFSETATLFDTLQQTATHCNPLQPTATHCNTLQHTATFDIPMVAHPSSETATHCNTATHCSALHHTVPHCITLQHTEAHCNTLHHTATHCNTLQRTATHCSALQHTASNCTILQHTATPCNTPQRLTYLWQRRPLRRWQRFLPFAVLHVSV